MTAHDISLDWFAMPEGLVQTAYCYPRPPEILWDAVGEKLHDIPLLQEEESRLGIAEPGLLRIRLATAVGQPPFFLGTVWLLLGIDVARAFPTVGLWEGADPLDFSEPSWEAP